MVDRAGCDRRTFLTAALGALTYLTWESVGRLRRPALAASTVDVVRFGYQRTLWGAPAMVADDLDVFRKAGAKAQLRALSSGKEVRDALIAGSLDAGSVGVTPFIVGAAKGQMVSIAVVAYTGGTLAAVGKTGAGIRTIPDFRRRRIASQKGSTTEYVFTHVIAPKFGLHPGDYQLVNVEFQDHVSALAAGSVDAFLGVEPYVSLAVVRGLGEEVVNYGEYDLAPLFLAANASSLSRNGDGMMLFLKGWLTATALFKKDPAETARRITAIFRREGYDIPQAVFTRALRHMQVNPYYLPGLRQYMEAQARAIAPEAHLQTMPDWDKVLRSDLLLRAQKG